MKKILLLNLLLGLFVFDAFAYKEQPLCDSYSFNKIKKSEIRKTDYANVGNSPAVVLYELKDVFVFSNYGRIEALNTTNRHFIVEETVTRKIKILSEQGEKYGVVKILYNAPISPIDSYSFVANVCAYSYVLSGSKRVKTALSQKDVKLTRIDEQTMQAEFAIPNAEEESIIEYSYTLHSVTLKDDVSISYSMNMDLPTLESVCQVWHDKNIWEVNIKNGESVGFAKSSVQFSRVVNGKAYSYATGRGTSEPFTLRQQDNGDKRNESRNYNYMYRPDKFYKGNPYEDSNVAYCDVYVYRANNLSTNTDNNSVVTVTLKRLIKSFS